MAHNVQLVEKMEFIASSLSCTPGQLALAWLLAQDDSIIPLFGTKSLKYLDENLGASDVVPKLTKEIVKDIDDLVFNFDVKGVRYVKVGPLPRIYVSQPPGACTADEQVAGPPIFTEL
jgi:diketogulonate reductase-like aldo/keto reductase